METSKIIYHNKHRFNALKDYLRMNGFKEDQLKGNEIMYMGVKNKLNLDKKYASRKTSKI